MAEQPQTDQEVSAPTADEIQTQDAEENFVPRGAFRFVIILIIGYALYFFLSWYEIVVLRGGGV